PLQLLALSAGFRAIFPLLAQVLVVLGETRVVMRYSVACVLVLPFAFWLLGRQWGTVGLALVWVAIFPLVVVPAYARALKLIDLTMTQYLRALWPAGSASLLMAVAVLAASWLTGSVFRPLRFGIEVVAGVLTYALSCWMLHRGRV